MSERRFRKPNAFKHGGFSKVELLPWEDLNEFEELHRGLKEEFGPEGPLQEDCVYTILSCMWRKRRVREKRNLDTASALDRVENRVLWEDPPPLFDTDIEGAKYSLANRRSEPRSKPPEDYGQLLGRNGTKDFWNFQSACCLASSPRTFARRCHLKISNRQVSGSLH